MDSNVKEEPLDNSEEPLGDELIASYDIVPVENSKFLSFNVCGLSRVLKDQDPVGKCEISIRTDQKEMKIVSQIRGNKSKPMVFFTKETNLNLKRRTYAVKFSRETGKAYFVLLHSIHSLTLVDDENHLTKSVDSQNNIFEDCVKLPHPSRNIHDQLRIEMKNHLYKPLKHVGETIEQRLNFLNQLFMSVSKRSYYQQPSTDTEKKPDISALEQLKSTTEKPNKFDLINCPHWYLNKINLCDIKNLDLPEWKIEVFTRKVQAIRFQELAIIFGVDAQTLLNALVNICYLIKGNWVIKSQILYRFDVLHDSEQKQSLMKLLIAARECILWYFATNKTLKSDELFEQQGHLFKKSTDFEEIINRLTVRTGSQSNVEFILPEDLNFISQYPSVAKKHHEKTREMLTSRHQEHLALLKSVVTVVNKPKS